MSGVGRALYPGGSATMDRATTKKLLELFDQKKNWMFQDLQEDGKIGDTGEEWSRENDLLGDERDNRQNPFFKSRGAVEGFLRSDEQEKRPRKKNRRRGQPERSPGEDDEGELSEFEMSPDKLKKDGRKKEESLFRSNSPFAAKTALADFSPFSRKNTKSTARYRTPGNRAGLNGNRLEAGKALGQAGAAGRGGFFQQQKLFQCQSGRLGQGCAWSRPDELWPQLRPEAVHAGDGGWRWRDVIRLQSAAGSGFAGGGEQSFVLIQCRATGDRAAGVAVAFPVEGPGAAEHSQRVAQPKAREEAGAGILSARLTNSCQLWPTHRS